MFKTTIWLKNSGEIRKFWTFSFLNRELMFVWNTGKFQNPKYISSSRTNISTFHILSKFRAHQVTQFWRICVCAFKLEKMVFQWLKYWHA